MIQSDLDGNQLWQKILESPPEWWEDGSKTLMANRQFGGIPKILDDTCWPAVIEIERLTNKRAQHLMVNRLPSGVVVPVHTDTMPDKPYRWHLPLKTSVHAFFWDEIDGIRILKAGFWHNVNYSIRHTIGNFGPEERVHLIVDLL